METAGVFRILRFGQPGNAQQLAPAHRIVHSLRPAALQAAIQWRRTKFDPMGHRIIFPESQLTSGNTPFHARVARHGNFETKIIKT